MSLRVIQAFGDRVVGEQITDADVIAGILASDQAAFVVNVTDPEPEKPAKAPAVATPSAS